MMRGIVITALVAVAACAGILGFTKPAPTAFPHRAHVVAGVSCVTCHARVENDGNKLHLPDDKTCVACHAKPHDTRSCTACHASPTTVLELSAVKDHLRFDHGKHLAGEAGGTCMRCHSNVANGDAHLRPSMATCFKCHDDQRDARRCDACHRDLAEEGTLPQSHLAHDGDWVREHGTRAASSGDLCETCHSRQSFCATCHGQSLPALPAKMQFANAFATSPHRGGFAARHSLEARADPGACSTCHAPDRCVACHTERGVAGDDRRTPHPRGWVGLTASENLHGREARRDPAACASCHGGAGEALCVQCHAVGRVGGNPHPPGWSSRQSLSALPCRLCHTTSAR